MAKQEPNRKLANALAAAKEAASETVIKHSQLKQPEIDLLKRAGYLTPVIRGWYLLSKPEASGTSTVWYVGFWPFVKSYLLDRFGKQGYCLSADSSVDLFVDESHIASQITAITLKASNQTVNLPEKTTLLLYADKKQFPGEITKRRGLYVMPLPLAICRLSPGYFRNKPLNVEIALKMAPSAAEISRILLDQGLISSAGRVAGAFRVIGEQKKADQIVSDMVAAGYDIKETNPFEKHTPVLAGLPRIVSPYVGRIEAMWKQMRGDVSKIFRPPPGLQSNEQGSYLKVIQERYEQDAYHSLSIEGYDVTEELIQKIASGQWDPEESRNDIEQLNAMAAKGYYHAFQVVVNSVEKVLSGESPGKVFEDDLQLWYREMFSPSVKANLIKASDLAGYRNGPVYIKNARHVPPPKDAVLDSMDILFKLLREEEHPAVRAVLGHFIFVYIHPYMDGNGRIARFVLNLMLVSGGYDWTVIRTGGRSRYMSSLEQASSDSKIKPFAKFVRSELEYWEKQSVSEG